MNVLSLFDGMSCGRIALDRANIKVNKYYASEIDKYAIKVSSTNYPDNVNLGSVVDINVSSLDKIDLLIGGSPCQSFSFAGKQNGMSTKCKQEITTLDQYLLLKMLGFEFEGQSYLFWEYIRVLTDIRKTNPDALFMLENVKMSKKWQDILSKTIGCEPILINSALVSAQNRKRLYWTNIPDIGQPEDKGILLKDIIENGVVDRNKSLVVTTRVAGATEKRYKEKRYKEKSMHQMIGVIKNRGVLQERSEKFMCIDANYWKGVDNHGQRTMIVERPCEPRGGSTTKESECHHVANATDINGYDILKRVYADSGKSPTLNSCSGGNREVKVQVQELTYRKLTPLECERLQTVPENYTNHVSNSQRYKMLGNGWTVDIIVHIFSWLKLRQLAGY